MQKNDVISELTLTNAEALANNENQGYTIRKGYLDNHQACTVREVYSCSIGFTIPSWVPYIGGTSCGFDYDDYVDFPGTQNLCTYTGVQGQECYYFPCRKH